MKILPLIALPALLVASGLRAQDQSTDPTSPGIVPEDGRMILRDTDRPTPYRIERNELVETGPDGVPVLVSIPDAASFADLRREAGERTWISGHNVRLTGFAEGRPRTDPYRRVVSERVLVHLAEGVHPALVAATVGAESWKALIYSPRDYVMTFGDCWVAIAAADALLSVEGVEDAYVMLGRKLFPLMIPEDVLFSAATANIGTYINGVNTVDRQLDATHVGMEPASQHSRLTTNAFQWYLYNTGENKVLTRTPAGGDKPVEAIPDWAPYYVKEPIRNRLIFPVDINVVDAWDAAPSMGEDVLFAIADSGVDFTHSDFRPASHRLNLSKSYVGDISQSSPAGSPFGATYHHGTSMAGIVLANTNNNNGRGMAGIASKAQYFSQRMLGGYLLDDDTASTLVHPAEITPGADFADPYDNGLAGQPSADVSVNAWTFGGDTGTTMAALPIIVERAMLFGILRGRGQKGIVYLFSGDSAGETMGNNNSGGTTKSMYSIHVGAVTDLGRRVGYSSPGASLHVVAPSHGDELAPRILANNRLYPSPEEALALETVGVEDWPASRRRRSPRIVTLENGNEYTNDFGGTSAATAMVAGVVGLMLGENPDLTWRDVQEILMRSANVVNPYYGGWEMTALGVPMSHYYGAGLVNAHAAVRMAKAWTNLPDRDMPPMSIMQLNNGGQRGIRLGTLATIPAELPRDPSPDAPSTNFAIPDNSPTAGNPRSLTRTVGAPPSGFRVEHVEIEVDIDHTRRGDLEIVLEAPPVGTQEGVLVDKLYVPHAVDTTADMRWRFMSLRHWGARYNGSEDWTLRITDTTNADGFVPNNAEEGRLRGYAVTFYGAFGDSPNKVPTIDNPSQIHVLAGRPYAGEVMVTTQPNAPAENYSFLIRSPVSPTPADAETGVVMDEPVSPFVPYYSETSPAFGGAPAAGVWDVELAAANVFGIGRKVVRFHSYAKFTYEQWQMVYFPTEDERDSIGKRRDDPDFDGRPNLIEFLTGGDPLVADDFDLPFLKDYEEVPHVVIQVDTGATGASIALQVSTDLETWEDVETTTLETSEFLTFRGAPLDTEGPRRFYRVRGN